MRALSRAVRLTSTAVRLDSTAVLRISRLVSSDSIPVGGFTPGIVLADRYRIIGLIGRGGMGEVYRADDLKLGQPVALKFLPKALADDSVRRERFYAEVRIARQVSHPNICRVYDIGELDGRHFLTMEYIDGEDLASLLKRIGNLHQTKALDVARQLCAGLAAAHDKGVLHRDLKPANVMLDGRGRVRVTDFGLAVAAGEDIPADGRNQEIGQSPAANPRQPVGVAIRYRRAKKTGSRSLFGCTMLLWRRTSPSVYISHFELNRSAVAGANRPFFLFSQICIPGNCI